MHLDILNKTTGCAMILEAPARLSQPPYAINRLNVMPNSKLRDPEIVEVLGLPPDRNKPMINISELTEVVKQMPRLEGSDGN